MSNMSQLKFLKVFSNFQVLCSFWLLDRNIQELFSCSISWNKHYWYHYWRVKQRYFFTGTKTLLTWQAYTTSLLMSIRMICYFSFFLAKVKNFLIKIGYCSYEVRGNLQLNYVGKCPLLIVLFRNLLNYCNIMIN